jgi:hypothetical protein
MAQRPVELMDEDKSKHRYSTVALVFMLFIFAAGAVIAALSGGGTPGYLVKWNTSTSIMDSIINETSDLITVFGELKLQTGTSETILYIENTDPDGDPQIQFGNPTIRTTLGVDDTGDLFEINYGTGLTSDPEFTLSTNTVTIGDAKLSYGEEIVQSPGDTTPSVSETNMIKTFRTSSSITAFDLSTEGQLLFIFCGRQLPAQTVEVIADHGAGMNLAGNANFVCASEGDMLTLIQIDGEWWETARAFQ